MSKPKIYLAGPITGCTYDEATDWRVNFAKLIGNQVQCLSPMRGKEFLREEKILGSGYDYPNPLASVKGIITRDFNDCTTCDLLIVNFLGAKIVSIGTCFEIAWKFYQQKPTIIIMEDRGNPHEHGFINGCSGIRVNNVDWAVQVAKSILALEE